MKRELDPCPTCHRPRSAETLCDACGKVIPYGPIRVGDTIEGETDTRDYCSVPCLLKSEDDGDGVGHYRWTSLDISNEHMVELLKAARRG